MEAFLFIASFVLVLASIIFCIRFFGFIYPFLFWGGIYVPTSVERADKMIDILSLNPGEKIIDLGAGDGRLVIKAALACAEARGCEICPSLVKLAKKNIREAGLENKAFVFQGNLWRQNLREYDAVIVYGMRHMMGRLEKKFEKELKPGARVVSNYFALPGWTPVKTEDNIYFYIKK